MDIIVELFFTVLALTPAAEAARQEVICAETSFSRAVEARDKAAFLSLVDPDARFVSGSVARGQVAVGEAWAGFLSADGPKIRWRPAIVEVTEDGDLALSRGPYRYRAIGEDGVVTETWGHFNSIWRRNKQGKWLVVFDAGGDAGMEPTDEEIAVLESEPKCP